MKFGESSSTRKEWQWQPGTGNIVGLRYHAAVIMKPDGTALKEMVRRSDRLWIDYAANVAAAGDGSFAILSQVNIPFGVKPAIAIYAKDGTPLHTVPLGLRWATLQGYNGTHVVLSSAGTWIFDKFGTSVHNVPTSDQGRRQQILLAREGRELWVVDTPTRTVQRYAMP